jgi:hypothetical protein
MTIHDRDSLWGRVVVRLEEGDVTSWGGGGFPRTNCVD